MRSAVLVACGPSPLAARDPRRPPARGARLPFAPSRAGRLTARGWILAALLAGPLLASAARASTEEFSTFSVEAQEADDESFLDHILTRPPADWRDDWERSLGGFRTSQGCLTSGQWFIYSELMARAPLGQRAWFGFDLLQHEADDASYNQFDLSFHFPTRWGTPGASFRPFHDKSRQDFALLWDAGADTTEFHLRAAFTIEDMFNNLWAFRQTRVGELSEPYERHPYEPGLDAVWRLPTARFELEGRYLTPSQKRVIASFVNPTYDIVTLWGTFARGRIEVQALGLEWALSSLNKQASGTDRPSDGAEPQNQDFRRQWLTEVAARRRFGTRFAAEGHWYYSEGWQSHDPPPFSRALALIHRTAQIEAQLALAPGWSARLGGLYDRITADQSGRFPAFSYGSRTESRLYFGLGARFGRVRVHAVEGIELDPESYEVWFVHDKGFFALQTSF